MLSLMDWNEFWIAITFDDLSIYTPNSVHEIVHYQEPEQGKTPIWFLASCSYEHEASFIYYGSL